MYVCMRPTCVYTHPNLNNSYGKYTGYRPYGTLHALDPKFLICDLNYFINIYIYTSLLCMYTSISIYAKYIVLLSLRITTIIIKISIHIYIYFREIIIKINVAIMIKKCQIYIYICIYRVEGWSDKEEWAE